MNIHKGMIAQVMLLVYGLTFLTYSSPVFANSPEHFDYPELNVVPRASERIESEAQQEGSYAFTQLLPQQISALATFSTGIVGLQNTGSVEGGYAGMITGGTWILVTTGLALFYRPYSSTVEHLKTLPKGSVREQLTRERIAEEEIRSVGGLGDKLRWVSILSELAASAYMLTKMDKGPNGTGPNYTGQGFAIGSMVLALAPLVFRPHWSSVADSQKEYKKRIYAPVAGPTLLRDPVSQAYLPGLMLSLSF